MCERDSTTRSVRLSVHPSVGRSVTLESKSGKTRISAPAHPSATDISRVSGLVFFLSFFLSFFFSFFLSLFFLSLKMDVSDEADEDQNLGIFQSFVRKISQKGSTRDAGMY